MARWRNFNPRSPWGERLDSTISRSDMMRFQSTLPVGGATRPVYDRLLHNRKISIHAPRGGSDGGSRANSATPRAFQSTLPVGGATITSSIVAALTSLFQSTLPVGGATPLDQFRRRR